MKPLRLIRSLPSRAPNGPSALTIGNFDGVHLGHLSMLERVKEAGSRLGLCPSVLTFSPHPKLILQSVKVSPIWPLAKLTAYATRWCCWPRPALSRFFLLPFNNAMANLSADDFIERLLINSIKTRWLLVGADFRFGHQRGGDVDLLKKPQSTTALNSLFYKTSLILMALAFLARRSEAHLRLVICPLLPD